MHPLFWRLLHFRKKDLDTCWKYNKGVAHVSRVMNKGYLESLYLLLQEYHHHLIIKSLKVASLHNGDGWLLIQMRKQT